MIVTISLTRNDFASLVYLLGVSAGRASFGKLQGMSLDDVLELCDKILVQGDYENYTYGKKKDEVIAKLKEEGILCEK
jgi:hypothetical protein